jgi:hypothetical protein
LKEDQREFEQQVESLCAVLVESLNCQGMQKVLPPPQEKGERSISKLERFLAHHQLTDCREHIEFLRCLWDLRSEGAAGHRKGRRYEKIATELGIAVGTLRPVFADLLKKAIAFLDYLSAMFLQPEKP